LHGSCPRHVLIQGPVVHAGTAGRAHIVDRNRDAGTRHERNVQVGIGTARRVWAGDEKAKNVVVDLAVILFILFGSKDVFKIDFIANGFQVKFQHAGIVGREARDQAVEGGVSGCSVVISGTRCIVWIGCNADLTRGKENAFIEAHIVDRPGQKST